MSRSRRRGCGGTSTRCPVPEGYDPRRVRPSIEAALFKLMGPHPVVIYCVGNLEYISRSLLEEISSSGIRLKHTPFGGVEFISLLRTWRLHEPGRPSTVFLISGDESWYTYRLVWSGFSWLRAYPGPEPLSAKDDCPSEKWLWKDLLEGSTETCEETPLKIRSRILEYEKPFFCRVCMFHFSSFDVFISYLKSRQHKKELLLSVVPLYYINNYPDNTCTLCEYPYYNDANRKLHLESDEHKAAAAASVSHEIEASLVDPLNTSQEKEDATRNRTSEEPLWKETN